MTNEPVNSGQFDSATHLETGPLPNEVHDGGAPIGHLVGDPSDDFGLPRVDVKALTIDNELLAEFPTRDIFRYKLLPIARHGDTVTIATCDPLNLEGLDELRARARIT